MAFVEYTEIEIQQPRQVRSLLIGYCMENMKCMTKSEQAYAITGHAIRAGYIEDRAPIYGLTLTDTFKRKSAPWWMTRTALDLLVLDQWTPSSAWQWTSFANAWLYAKGPFKSLDEVLESLPCYIKHEEALHWFENISSRFCLSDSTKPVSRIVDKNNQPLTLKFLSAEKAKKHIVEKYGWASWEEAVSAGCAIDHRHKPIIDLLNDRELVPADRDYLISYIQNNKMLSHIKIPAKPVCFKYLIQSLFAKSVLLNRRKTMIVC